ncbi:MAG: tagatose 1,6-diphosphate aldolase [Candidatus Acetothermia bacterium]
MKLSKGKFDRMEKLSDERGVIKAAAMDQRGSLVRRLSDSLEAPKEDVNDQVMEEFKQAISAVLTPYSSAILLDPEWGFPAAEARAENTGLILSYEKSSASKNHEKAYSHSLPGKMTELIPDWSVRKAVENGADAVKLLTYYHPSERSLYNEQKMAMVERVGAECAHHQIPFFLEFVGYDPEGKDWGSDPELAEVKPEVVKESIREFSRNRYQVDVLKVEFPVNMKYVRGTNAYVGKNGVYDREEALQHFQKTAEIATKPMIYLSAGVDAAEMRESLKLANQARASWHGVLCGRATWQDGISEYSRGGVKGLRSWLEEGGVENITRMNEIIDEGAKPWYEAYGGRKNLEITD